MDFAYDKFPPGTIALKISPVNDLETPGELFILYKKNCHNA